MPFRIIRNDITRVKADAIVNTANPEPCFGGGTDAAVYKAAGAEELLAERKKIGRIAPGEAIATAAYALPAQYIIHTVGPVWIDGNHGEADILRSCYRKSLLLAEQLGCKSIAFPLIATGGYGFPKDLALDTALSEIRDYLEEADMDVTLVVFERKSWQLAADLEADVKAYIDENYVREKTDEEYGGPLSSMRESARRRRLRERYGDSLILNNIHPDMPPAQEYEKKKPSLEDVILHPGESFQQRLFRMIDERGMTDPEVYKRANIDRKLFSKIRCSDDYIPKKKTVIALAIALCLNMDDTKDLLASAGYALSDGSKTDLIVSYCIDNGIWDIYEVNALLFRFNQPLLG